MLQAFERFSLGAEAAWIIAAGLFVAGSLLVWRVTISRPRCYVTALVVREAGIVMALYGLWMYIGAHSGTAATGAYSRAQRILDAERATHLDIEKPLQTMILPHHGVVQFANIFYATAHFGAIMAFLVWAFVRHRDRYPGIRARVVVVTLTALLIQFVAVAPPRLLHGSGLVDTPLRYGSSVYPPGFAQVAAMPSVHVAWAVLIAWEVLRCSASRYRAWIVVHPILTTWVVMVTGNHWLFDGLAGAAIVTVVELVFLLWRRTRAAKRMSHIPAHPRERVLVR